MSNATVTYQDGNTIVSTDQGTFVYPPNSHLNRQTLIVQLRLWTVGIILVLAPFIYLWAKPDHYTPLVDVMFSLFLALIFYQLGGKSVASESEARARDKWMPQAESVAKKLLTLHASVQKLSNRVRNSCHDVANDLPELQAPEMKAIRIKLKSDCENAAERMDDVAHQLEDAVEDWERFLYANCETNDCGRITQIMEQQRIKLAEQLKPPVACNLSAAESNAAADYYDPDEDYNCTTPPPQSS